jgi:peptidoglycan hydrolase CwlO-like protein
MKKFELRNLINEIVQRKLNEARSQIADTVNKIASEGENNGVLYFSINTDSVEQNETIQEIGEVGAMGIASPESGMKDSDKRSLATYQAALDKFTNDIRKIDADVAKLHASVQRKIEGLERKKASLAKKQGQIVDRINAIKDKQ